MLRSEIQSEIFDLPVPSRHGKERQKEERNYSLFSCPIPPVPEIASPSPARETSMPAGNNGSVMKSSGRQTHLVGFP
jgi:hypothetical protein